MQTILYIMSKSNPTGGAKMTINPSHVPRKGDKVDMGFSTANEVIEVLWQFDPQQTIITCVVD